MAAEGSTVSTRRWQQVAILISVVALVALFTFDDYTYIRSPAAEQVDEVSAAPVESEQPNENGKTRPKVEQERPPSTVPVTVVPTYMEFVPNEEPTESPSEKPNVKDEVSIPSAGPAATSPGIAVKGVETNQTLEDHELKVELKENTTDHHNETANEKPVQTVVILPGPHKTGTSTVQFVIYNWLQSNSETNPILNGKWCWPIPTADDFKSI